MKTKNLQLIDQSKYIFTEDGKIYSKRYNREIGQEWNQDPRYHQVCLSLIDGTFKFFLVHDVIAYVFIPLPNNIAWEDLVVDHIIPVSEGGTHAVNNLRWTDLKGNANNERTKRNMANASIGRKQSKETIQKRIEKVRGRKHTDEQRHNISKGRMKPIIQYTLDGEFVREWESAKTAGETLGVSYGNISNCVHNTRKSAYGYVWKAKQ